MQIVAREQVDPCTVSLDIEVDPETVNKAFARAYRDLGQFTSVPGFRPGKAPRAMLERYVNQEKLREHVTEILAPSAFQDAIRQEDIQPYTDPEAEFGDLAEGRPWRFKVRVPTPPRVTLGSLENIEVERPVFSVDEKDVEAQIESLRSEYAKIQPAGDRGAQIGDMLIAEMSTAIEGAEPGEPRRSLIRVGNNIPGFDDAILGIRPDEERTFELTYPEDFPEAELAGKKARFTVRAASVNERVLPEVTDEWVREVTPYQSVEELRAGTRARLEEVYRHMSEGLTESAILNEILKRSTVEFPSVMVQAEVAQATQELREDLSKRGITYDQYLQANGLTREQHQEQIVREAVHRVQRYLILREIARVENVEITEEELRAELAKLTEGTDIEPERVEAFLEDEGRRNRLAESVLTRKLRDLLFEKAIISEKPAGS